MTARIDVSREAEIVAVMGSSGSGKSSYIKAELRRRKPRRLVVYDPDEEYGPFGRVVSKLGDVLSVMRQAGTDKPFKLVFRPSSDPGAAARQFDALCKLCFHAGGVTFVAEELADVTTPSRAPVGWSMLSRRGRKRGIVLFGASQRPANIDKNFLGNATRVRCGVLSYEQDANVCGRVLGVDPGELMTLAPLAYVERSQGGETVRGVLKL